MLKSKKADGFFIAAIIGVFAVVIFLLWLSFKIPIVGIGFMVSTAVFSGLALANKFKFISVNEVSDAVGMGLLACCICAFMILFKFDRYKASISSMFVSGHVVKGERVVEPENGGTEYYEDAYSFKAANSTAYTVSQIIVWGMLVIGFVTIYLNWNFWSKALKLKDEYGNGKKYSY